jgi:hypothetical protein
MVKDDEVALLGNRRDEEVRQPNRAVSATPGQLPISRTW